MMKYLVAVLVFLVLLAGLLFYIGDDATLLLSTTAAKPPFAFSPVELTWQAVILFGTGFMLAMITIWSVLLWIWRLPRRMKSGVGMRKRNRAIDAMEDALIAGAEGDMKQARKASARVRELMGSTDLGRIISATTAEACGDHEEAMVHYEAMMDSAKTRPTAQRGLAQSKLARGDFQGAVEAAREAFDQNARARWAFDTLFKALVADYRWTEAGDALDKGKAAKHLDSDVYDRRKAVLLSAEADYWLDNGQHDKALQLAQAGLKHAPDFAPAAAIAAYELSRTGAQKKAASLLGRAWNSYPHPALAIAYLDLYPGESMDTQEGRIDRFVTSNAEHREARLLRVSHYLRAGDPVEALSILSPMLEEETLTTRLCLLAAEAERALGNRVDASLWTERAATAAHERDWSDLDPEGSGFDYELQDWCRLIFSFGDKGELIHPRGDRAKAVRRPTPAPEYDPLLLLGPDGESEDSDGDDDTDDLARRFDDLLDGSKDVDKD